MLIFLSLKNSLNLLEYLDGVDDDVNDDDIQAVGIDDDGITDEDEADDDDVINDKALGDVGVVRGIDIVLDGDEQRELCKLMYALLPCTSPRQLSMVMEKQRGLSSMLLPPDISTLPS